ALPAGFDPADLADGFDQRLARAESYLGYRVRLEIERAADRQEAFVSVREVLARFEDSPERQDAIRYAADKLDLPKETQAGLAPRIGASATGRVSPRLLDAGDRLERNALAGVTRSEIERAADRQEAFVSVREVLARFEDSPERQDAIRYAADKLDLPKETQAGLAPRIGASATGRVSPRLLDAGDRLERNALAGVT